MSEKVTRDGEVFTLLFNKGLPPPLAGHLLFLLNDGSIHSGELIGKDGKRVLRTTNPAGGLHTVIDISESRIDGYATCSPLR